MDSSAANADCSVERRQAAGNSFRVIQCDESRAAINGAISRASEHCATLAPEIKASCYEAVRASFRLRREAMLRRALKEGGSVTAAAQLYGYTEKKVERWIAKNAPTDRGYTEPDEVPAEILQAQKDLATFQQLAHRERGKTPRTGRSAALNRANR
jgi:hypothetical protein